MCVEPWIVYTLAAAPVLAAVAVMLLDWYA